eukprot:gnl/TRDRNA2_/TRDRNA2_136512_c0_seq1.p1 gnl/TRDRNA2_/TRDRNA2_136512_c0~~gnl/TRDRNA2_/TRDRNA2_136512_c0_seq1.p1  ORF type:complete len:457 (-),score=55.35 gnl/TRDRNA2_/TRDRNA2_136512_c0_seq1:90-1268(-)
MGTSLLGDPVVLWRDQFGTARCVADKCPHRSAPLSLGHVHGETGAVECLYHGWQVDGASGKVTHIPALQAGKPIPSTAYVRTYAVSEQDGVVWVWAGLPEDAVGAEPPPRDLSDDGMPLASAESGFACQLLVFDLPIDHSLMIENLLDPAHVPFAHEGTIGRRSAAQPLEMRLTKTPRGILGSVKDGYYNAFVAPCNIVLHTPPKPGKLDMYQYVGCTPTAPGQMRMVYRAYRNFALWIDRVPPLRRYFDSFSLKIVFQDYQLLLGQQRRLSEKGNPWNSSIQVDMLPLLYRRYYQRTFGNVSKDGPWWRGWDGNLDMEDLAKIGAWDKDFDCGGCAVPRRPHHPQNPLDVPGAPGVAPGPVPVVIPRGRDAMLLLASAAAGAAVAVLLSSR